MHSRLDDLTHYPCRLKKTHQQMLKVMELAGCHAQQA